jgi:integrase
MLKVNEVEVPCILTPQQRPVHPDRAPRPEEIQRMLAAGDLRDRVIVSCLALGGFREGTLAGLRYYHVREGLERGEVPLHVHVEAEITKGKYADYDTFLGAEAVDALRLYLDQRRQGSICEKTPPEEIVDNSPLIRDKWSSLAKPVTSKRIGDAVRELYMKAGLVKRGERQARSLRAHSLRKFFRTQLAALGMTSDYIDYMMGHKISTYNDVKMKGVDFLRGKYAQADLRIKPKDKSDIYDFIEDLVKGKGGQVDRDLLRKAITQPHRTVVWSEEERRRSIREDFMKLLKDELMEEAGREEVPEKRRGRGD